MRKILLLCFIIICCFNPLRAQQFISITPDFGQSGQTISTVVTGSGFYFTMGSMPSVGGSFYMFHGNTFIYPSGLSLIDDDNFEALWNIPLGVPIGNYVVRWDFDFTWNTDVPGGFNIDCIAPPAQILNGSVSYVCAGDSIELEANTGTGLNYQWYKYGVIIPGATSSTYYATTSGYYKVRVADTQNCGRFTSEVYVGVTNIPLPTITPSFNQQICAGSFVNFQASFSLNYTYQWFLNGTPIPGETNILIQAYDAGSYTVRVTGLNGCTRMSNPVTLSHDNGPAAIITPSGSTTFCVGNNIDLVANSGTGYTYQWYRYGIAIAGATSQLLNVTKTGSYKVNVTDANGCSKNSAAVIVTVIPPPPAVISVQGPSAICPGDSTLLMANSGTGFTYQWYRYGIAIAGATSQALYVKRTGMYRVSVIHPIGCSRNSAGVLINVLPLPTASILPLGPTSFCAGDNVELHANTGTGYTYSWNRYGITIMGATASSYTASTTGKYKAVVTSPNGCFKVSNPVDVAIVCRIANQTPSSDIELYPNPAYEFISIEGSEINFAEILNSAGSRVRVLDHENLLLIDISDLSPGLYITVIHHNGSISTKRFIKK